MERIKKKYMEQVATDTTLFLFFGRSRVAQASFRVTLQESQQQMIILHRKSGTAEDMNLRTLGQLGHIVKKKGKSGHAF